MSKRSPGAQDPVLHVYSCTAIAATSGDPVLHVYSCTAIAATSVTQKESFLFTVTCSYSDSQDFVPECVQVSKW